MRRLAAALLAAVLVLPACQPGPSAGRQTPEEAVERIRELDRRWLTLVEESDAAAIADLYAEDARVLPPGDEPAVGREAIRDLWGEIVQLPSLTFAPDTVVVSGSVGIAYEVGRAEVEMPNPQGDMRTMSGKYVVVWERRDGEWKVVLHIYNFDEAP